MNRPGQETLIRYFNGQCNDGEKEAIELYLALGIDAGYITDCLLEAAGRELPQPVINKEELNTAWHKLQKRQQQSITMQPEKRRFYFSYAAAIVVLVFGAALFYLFNKDNNRVTQHQITWQQYRAGAGQVRQLQLPDSSIVTLFAGAELNIPDNFGDTDRNIQLRGRAFFDVTHQPAKPFKVTAQELTTRVLGTRFEVNAPVAESGAAVITLHSGKVSVYHEDREIARLHPDQQLRFDNKRQYSISRVAAAYTLSWMKGELDYDQATLQTILDDLERWYGVKFLVPSSMLNIKITISFKELPVEQALDMLSRSADFSYTRESDHLITIKERRPMK